MSSMMAMRPRGDAARAHSCIFILRVERGAFMVCVQNVRGMNDQ